MPTIEEDLSKVKEDHLERLLNAYETRSKEFQRLFSSLVIFALIFLFIILLPYIALQIKNHEISDALTILQNQMEPIAIRLKAYQQAQNGIQDLSQQLNDSPEELHNYINDLASICNSSSGSGDQFVQQSPTSNQNCPNDKAQRDVWLNQQIQDHIQQQFVDFDTVINQEVITPLHSLDEVSNLIDIAALTNGLNNLHSAFKTKLDENPSFWKKFEDKVSFYTQLDQELGGVWSNYDSEIKSQGEKLKNELTKMETEKESQENQQQQLVSEETKISDRLNGGITKIV